MRTNRKHTILQAVAKDMSTSVTRSGIEELRARIRRLEGSAGGRRLVLPFGIKAIDQHLPGGGLTLGALHEVAGGGHARSTARPRRSLRRESRRGCVARCSGVSHSRILFAPALAQAGLVPDRVIYVEAGDEKSVLVCFEEGLRTAALALS